MGFPLPVPCAKQIVIHGKRRCHRRVGQVSAGTQVGGVAVEVGGAVSGSVSQKVAVPGACPLSLP